MPHITWTEHRAHPDVEAFIAATDEGICALQLGGSEADFLRRTGAGNRDPEHPLLVRAAEELAAYFRGELREFTVPVDLHGTPFQLSVWQALRRIPYGELRTYTELATEVGCKAARAVGQANGRNPVAVIVPCHRVVAADGSLAGFASGLDHKRLLLTIEGSYTALY